MLNELRDCFFLPVMCEHFSQKERWVINKPKHALENPPFKTQGGESSFTARLLVSLYISWQMKTNACEKAPCSRGAFHKLITCNSILVHLGAWRVPDAHIMRGHINERSFTSSSKQEKHRWPGGAASPEARRLLWMERRLDPHHHPHHHPSYALTKSSSPCSHQDFIKQQHSPPPPQHTHPHTPTLPRSAPLNSTPSPPAAPVPPSLSALSCATLLPNQMRKWLVWWLTDSGLARKDKWPKVLEFNTLTKPTWSAGLMLEKIHLWKNKRCVCDGGWLGWFGLKGEASEVEHFSEQRPGISRQVLT